MFTKIIYINLDRRSDRNELMKKEFEKINWTGEIERISERMLIRSHFNVFQEEIVPHRLNYFDFNQTKYQI
jgi:predicted AlkP superfamily phosphohydrolase/phosphomutase